MSPILKFHVRLPRNTACSAEHIIPNKIKRLEGNFKKIDLDEKKKFISYSQRLYLHISGESRIFSRSKDKKLDYFMMICLLVIVINSD